MTATPEPLVEVIREEPGWEVLPDLEAIAEAAARAALAGAGLAAEGYQIALLAASDTRLAALNSDFRGKPLPTNVLSWPAFPLAPATPGAVPPPPPPGEPERPTALGDVALALQTVVAEAKTANRPLNCHVFHLILHAVLHLLGYDHQVAEDAARMEGIERERMAEAGFPDPYI